MLKVETNMRNDSISIPSVPAAFFTILTIFSGILVWKRLGFLTTSRGFLHRAFMQRLTTVEEIKILVKT